MTLPCQWILTFFGPADDYRNKLWSEIFQIAYFSNGGFTHHVIYNMPTFKRRFYLEQLISQKRAEKEEVDKTKTGKKYPKPPSVRPKK